VQILFVHLKYKYQKYESLRDLISRASYFLAPLILVAILITTSAFASSVNKILDTQNLFGSRTSLQRQNLIDRPIRMLRREYEFIFFYRTTCQHCVDFAPVLRSYSDNSGIQVKAFVVGVGSSPYFTNSAVVPQEVVNKFFGSGSKISVPTLFILNKNNFHAYPVSSGALTYLELTSRMNELTPKILRHERIARNKV
jgi:type-F conjugative transfer system pilin assembly thiol-disulfide isomerase TrbB